jgi:hypothetical protein
VGVVVKILAAGYFRDDSSKLRHKSAKVSGPGINNDFTGLSRSPNHSRFILNKAGR